MTKVSRRTLLKMAATAPVLAAPFILPRSAFAQTNWPQRTISIVLPYGPAGAAGIVAQAMSTKMTESLGQPVIVLNRPGGNTVIGASALLEAPADGYTMFWGSANQITNPLTMRDLSNINYYEDFVPVSQIARFPSILAVREDFPAQTIEEFIEYARANPGVVTCGTHSTVSVPHLAMELMQKLAGIELVHVPYQGASVAVQELMGGQVDAVIVTTSTISPAVEGGQARLIAVTGAERAGIYPDVPTLAESGFPGFDLDDWAGMFYKTGVPDEIVQAASLAIGEACRDPLIAEPQAQVGTQLIGNSPEEFAAFLEHQRSTIEELVAELGLEPE